jgi:hypothetical protein
LPTAHRHPPGQRCAHHPLEAVGSEATRRRRGWRAGDRRACRAWPAPLLPWLGEVPDRSSRPGSASGSRQEAGGGERVLPDAASTQGPAGPDLQAGDAVG